LRLQDTTSLLSSSLSLQPKLGFIILIHSLYIFIFSSILYIIIFLFHIKVYRYAN